MTASPNDFGVAEASTYSQRGVITAVPNEISLGFTRWTRMPLGTAAGAERKFTMFNQTTLPLTTQETCAARAGSRSSTVLGANHLNWRCEQGLDQPREDWHAPDDHFFS